MRITLFYILLLSFFSSAKAQNAADQRFVGYLFAYFEGRGEGQEQLRFALSDDAVTWRTLNEGKPIVASDSISESGGIRDPHILRGENGDYFIVATDMHTLDPKQAWGANPGIVMLRSTDLVNWTHSRINLSKDYPRHFSDAHWVWAPQTIYDSAARKYMIYFTLKRSTSADLVTYYAYANRDFTGFESEPRVLFRAKYGCIDNDIVQGPDGLFHMFYKGNTKDADGKEVNNGIQQAVARRLKGPWTEQMQYVDAYAGTPTAVEGSSVFRLNGQDRWVLMYDLYGSGRYEYQTTTDLQTFSQTPQSFDKDFSPRHGSVISLTRSEMQRLQERYGYVATYEFESHGNPIIRHMFTADPAVLVEGDTLWLLAGHDMQPNQSGYVMKDWLLFSTTDLKHWTQHPSPLHIRQFKWAIGCQAYAAHPVKGPDGRYYIYVSTSTTGIGVAVSDRITGPYHDALGRPLLTTADCFDSRHSWCCIDPAIFIDDDGTPYIIWGNRQCYMARLKPNMTELDSSIRRIPIAADHPFEEAPWLHKYQGRYYLTYASQFPEKIAYAVSDNVFGPYDTRTVISEVAGNSNTTHPAIVQFHDRWYFFSHNGTLRGGTSFSRSVVCEPLSYDADGNIQKIHPTSD